MSTEVISSRITRASIVRSTLIFACFVAALFYGFSDHHVGYGLTTAAAALLIVETVLIAVLLIQRSRRARAAISRRISEENLQKLCARLISLHDEEQRRIAAQLHDGVGQSLAIICNRAMLGKENASDPESVIEQFEEIKATAISAIDEMHEITHNLRPLELDRLGLAAGATLTIRLRVEGQSNGQ